jgi:hypothetical protein
VNHVRNEAQRGASKATIAAVKLNQAIQRLTAIASSNLGNTLCALRSAAPFTPAAPKAEFSIVTRASSKAWIPEEKMSRTTKGLARSAVLSALEDV